MKAKFQNSHIHELELMYWDTVIQVLGACQNIDQPSGWRKEANPEEKQEQSQAEYILLAAAGLGIGIIIGAISRL
jgi:hypothetical protein